MDNQLRKNNSSGFTGVSFDPKRNKYQVRCNIGKQSFFLGYVSNPEYGALVYENFKKTMEEKSGSDATPATPATT